MSVQTVNPDLTLHSTTVTDVFLTFVDDWPYRTATGAYAWPVITVGVVDIGTVVRPSGAAPVVTTQGTFFPVSESAAAQGSSVLGINASGVQLAIGEFFWAIGRGGKQSDVACAGTVAAGDLLYIAANGLVSDVVSGSSCAYALTAAAGGFCDILWHP